MNNEPTIEYTTLRDSIDSDGMPIIDIECRFNDGQKFVAIQVDGDFPQLAQCISNYLNSNEYKILHRSETK